MFRIGKLRGAQYLIQSNISIKYCVPGTCDVTFDYKDYRDDKDKPMRLGGPEFLRRFLIHVLPQGFVRIRHYGFLSNRSRKQKLRIIRQCLKAPPSESNQTTTETKQHAGITPATCRCPKCKKGRLQVYYEIPATPLYGR